MTLEVIGTGFGRTGTDSMRGALEVLGFAPCHHMRALVEDPAQLAAWMAAMQGGPRDWDVLLGGFRACVDWPSALYWPELVERYPEAKVILTLRSAESWWSSFERTIMTRIAGGIEQEKTRPGSSLPATVARTAFGTAFLDRDMAIAAYEANVAKVRATVPAARLLVHEVGDGWAPLCAHLGVDVPDVPYPHTNSAETFIERGGLRGPEAQ